MCTNLLIIKKKKLLGEILTIIKSLSFIKFKHYYYES